jgi:aspartate/methionine/tyrosine aminotransferase
MLEAVEFARIVAWARANRVRVISDEIYHGITYDLAAPSAWQHDRETVVIGSFSKYFSMTGWRIGWLLMPHDLADRMDRLAGNFAICPPALSQQAALAAFSAYDECDANVSRYAANRALLLSALPAIGLDTFAPPDGAFYVYADVSRWTAETGVAVAPGIDFDPVDGGKFVRMSFAGDGDVLGEAVGRLGAWLAGHPTR